MSWQASDWMDGLPYDVAKALATRVLLKLANVAAQDGTRAYRNTWEVATELGVDRRSIMRALVELQRADLIRPGDQRAVAHIRGDRRPTVYDLNFGFSRMYAQPEIPFPDWSGEDPVEHTTDATETTQTTESHGVTQLSTGSHGVTNGVTTAVALGTNGTTYSTIKREALELEQAQAPKSEKDASGDSLRAAQRRADTFSLRASLHAATHQNSAEICRGRAGRKAHDFSPLSGWCEHCETRQPIESINESTGEVA